jgi:uncharacterized membrane protein
MKITRLNGVSIALALVMFGIAAWFYPHLPDPVPTHWNAAGEVNGWTPKPWGVLVFPVMTLGLIAVLLVLPVISPRGFRLDSARRVYDIVIFIVAAFMAVVQVYTYRSAIAGGSDLVVAVPVMVGLLFMALGNYLGKFPKNFFVGIRTPWTLASDVVWARTHRLAGWLFIVAGLAIVIGAFFGSPPWLMITAIAAAAAIPFLYSLFLYRRLEGFRPEDD